MNLTELQAFRDELIKLAQLSAQEQAELKNLIRRQAQFDRAGAQGGQSGADKAQHRTNTERIKYFRAKKQGLPVDSGQRVGAGGGAVGSTASDAAYQARRARAVRDLNTWQQLRRRQQQQPQRYPGNMKPNPRGATSAEQIARGTWGAPPPGYAAQQRRQNPDINARIEGINKQVAAYNAQGSGRRPAPAPPATPRPMTPKPAMPKAPTLGKPLKPNPLRPPTPMRKPMGMPKPGGGLFGKVRKAFSFGRRR